jgi:PAS domain S-box-containing protein
MAVFDASMFAVAILDREARVSTANQALCDLMGYASTAIVHRPIQSFFHPDEPTVPARVGDLLSYPPLTEQVSMRHVMRRDGTSRWVVVDVRLLSGRPMRKPGSPARRWWAWCSTVPDCAS